MRFVRFLIRGIITIGVTMLLVSLAEFDRDFRILNGVALFVGFAGAIWTFAGLGD